MRKSPLGLARTAQSVARESIPAYSSKLSRRDFTLHQHFVLLALREFLKTDYRGLEQILKDWAELREVLAEMDRDDAVLILATDAARRGSCPPA